MLRSTGSPSGNNHLTNTGVIIASHHGNLLLTTCPGALGHAAAALSKRKSTKSKAAQQTARIQLQSRVQVVQRLQQLPCCAAQCGHA
jgi:hypothetical protein